MIAQKIKAFRCEIRQRSHQKKMERVRFMYWLEDNCQYEETIQQFLYLVAQSKFQSQRPSLHFFSQLISLLENKNKDWNAYIVLCQQAKQLDLLSVVCQKVQDPKLVCDFLSLMVMRNHQEIKNEELKEVVNEIQQGMVQGSLEFMMKRTLKDLAFILKIHSNRLQHEKVILSRLGDLLAFLIPFSRTETNQSLQILFDNHLYGEELLTSLAHLMFLFQNDFAPFQLLSFLKIIAFVMPFIYNQNQEGDIHNEILLKMFSTALQSPTTKEILKKEDPLLLLNVLGYLEINEERFGELIYTVIDFNSDSEKLNEEFLACLHRVSYCQEWLCYSHIRNLILKTIEGLKTSNSKVSPFSFLPHQPLKAQATIIKIISNVLSNEYSHNCQYDYYEVLEQICEDLLARKVLEEWENNWMTAKYLQFLLNHLLNCKKERLKLQVLKVCSRMGKWKLKKGQRRKISLYCRLYGIEFQYYGESEEEESLNLPDGSEEDDQ